MDTAAAPAQNSSVCTASARYCVAACAFSVASKGKGHHPATDLFDPAHPLFDKTCVLTGELLKLSDREAMQRIADFGGKNADNVTKKTDFLIVGGGSPSEKKSGKVRKAEEYIEKGIPIRIISEEEFLQM